MFLSQMPQSLLSAFDGQPSPRATQRMNACFRVAMALFASFCLAKFGSDHLKLHLEPRQLILVMGLLTMILVPVCHVITTLAVMRIAVAHLPYVDTLTTVGSIVDADVFFTLKNAYAAVWNKTEGEFDQMVMDQVVTVTPEWRRNALLYFVLRQVKQDKLVATLKRLKAAYLLPDVEAAYESNIRERVEGLAIWATYTILLLAILSKGLILAGLAWALKEVTQLNGKG